MKIGLSNGACGRRYNCKNVDKKCCEPCPEKKEEKYIECEHFEEK